MRRWIVLALPFALAVGCARARPRREPPPPRPPPARHVISYPNHLKAPDGAFVDFVVRSWEPVGPDLVIDGKPVPPDTKLYGLFSPDGKELAPVEFRGPLEVPNSRVAFVRRWPTGRLTRVRLDGSEPPTPTDAKELSWALTNGRFNNHGLDPAQARQGPLTVLVFDDDWRELFRLTDVARLEVPEAYQHVSYHLHQDWPVERLASGDVIAHHRAPDGTRFSVIYDQRGEPLGPPLPQLFRIPTGETTRQYVFPTTGGLFWPLAHDGSPEVFSGEVLGVIPLVSRAQWALTYMDRLEGWAVKARTPAGERWGVFKDLSALHGPLPVDAFEFDALHVPDEARVKWTPFHVQLVHPWLVVRKAGEARFEFYVWPRKTGGLVRALPDRTWASPQEVWDWAVAASQTRQVAFEAQVKQQQAEQELARQRASAAADAEKRARFARYEAGRFVAPESRQLARELGGAAFGRWCVARPDQCTDVRAIELALMRMDPRTNEYTALRQHVDRLAPPPPPRRRGFKVGDLFGTGAPRDPSFDNYRRGWQNWYYQDGQLVTKPR